MKKTLEFVDAMGNVGVPAPFIDALQSGRLNAAETSYISSLVAEVAAVQAFCMLAGEKLTREELNEIAELLRWEELFLFFIRASFFKHGLLDGEFHFNGEYDEALRVFDEFVEASSLAEDDE